MTTKQHPEAGVSSVCGVKLLFGWGVYSGLSIWVQQKDDEIAGKGNIINLRLEYVILGLQDSRVEKL